MRQCSHNFSTNHTRDGDHLWQDTTFQDISTPRDNLVGADSLTQATELLKLATTLIAFVTALFVFLDQRRAGFAEVL